MAGLAGCGAEPQGEPASLLDVPGAKTEDFQGNTTLKFVPPQELGQATSALSEAAVATASRPVSVFYPKPGQATDGLCWEGLTSDSAGNIYPVANSGVTKLDRRASIINGKDDLNFFANEPFSSFAVVDEAVGKLFAATVMAVRAAPFRAGATFTDLLGGIKAQGTAVAIGRGPLAGSLFVTDAAASRIYRVKLQPLSIKLFASGAPLNVPESIASAPDGTLYVINVGSVPEPEGRAVLKIATNGSISVFARATDRTARRMLAVNSEGTVFWSSQHGIDRFRPNGTRLAPLPGPNDQPAFENPMGAAFDPQGNLYVVENFGCKKIYKYTR